MMTHYSPVSDLTVVSICLVMIVLLFFSYTRNSRSFRIFLCLIGLLILAANVNVSYHMLADMRDPSKASAVMALRCVFHGLLFLLFVLFIAYIAEVTRLSAREKKLVTALAVLLFVIFTIADLYMGVKAVRSLSGPVDVVSGSERAMMVGYITFVLYIVALLAYVRDRLYRRVMLGFYGTMLISFLMLYIQGLSNDSSYTVASFLYPVIAMFYTLHANPYNVQLGSLDSSAFLSEIKSNVDSGREFFFLSLYLHNLDDGGALVPEEVQAQIRKYSVRFFKGAKLFRISRGHVIMLVPIRKNPDYEQRTEAILRGFGHEYDRFRLDYKIVIGRSMEEISRKNEYVNLIRSIHVDMPENSVHRVDESDVMKYRRNIYILRELEDIYKKDDLDDPRVLVYCQPVYNIRSGRYDTAEALMRLNLSKTGLIFPNEFIPAAEENGYVHVLTKTILHKTCEEARKLLDEGYLFDRISVNVSVPELRDEGFCEDIYGIVEASRIPGDKIAIEITESQNEGEFLLVKRKINDLRERGIKLYLDDFGTGYSNMERIMELPFDIIKFDRSMVLASDSSERSKELVASLANMFARMNYSVLYEGVETEAEEEMCKGMAASFLQGYKYSRPVPIEELEHYFIRNTGMQTVAGNA